MLYPYIYILYIIHLYLSYSILYINYIYIHTHIHWKYIHIRLVRILVAFMRALVLPLHALQNAPTVCRWEKNIAWTSLSSMVVVDPLVVVVGRHTTSCWHSPQGPCRTDTWGAGDHPGCNCGLPLFSHGQKLNTKNIPNRIGSWSFNLLL